MNDVLQMVAVSVVVATASSYAAIRLMPAAWRRVLASRAGSLTSQIGMSPSIARRVEAKLSTGGACGSCDSCKACATPPAAASATGKRTISIRRL